MEALGRSTLSPLAMPLTNRLMRDSQQSQWEQAAGPAQLGSFGSLLQNGVAQVNSMQHHADTQIQELLTGGDVNQAEVFTAVQKADMAFRMLVQVRNKLMAAYEEINNIRI